MSGLEIERKFLVKDRSYRDSAFSSSRIKQGYIPAQGCTVRVRQRGDKCYLTIKGPSLDGGLSRYEFEKEITLDEADHLFEYCTEGAIIDKTRFLVKSGHHTFEVDEFYGDNEGLVVAEVELSSPDETFEKPDFIGDEVTGDRRYTNRSLSRTPYREWTKE